jgi:hypothetical protein
MPWVGYESRALDRSATVTGQYFIRIYFNIILSFTPTMRVGSGSNTSHFIREVFGSNLIKDTDYADSIFV